MSAATVHTSIGGTFSPPETVELDARRDSFAKKAQRDLHECGGYIYRDMPLEKFVEIGKHALRHMIALGKIPKSELGDIMTLGCEAMSNARKYGSGPCMRYFYRTFPGTLLMVYRYATPPFEPETNEPDPYSGRGWGLIFMRKMAQRLEFEFSEGALKLTIEKRWPV